MLASKNKKYIKCRKLTSEERESSYNRFENFLSKNKLCYFRNKGILSRNSNSKIISERVYSIFVSTNSSTSIEKFNILLSTQKSFLKSEKAPRGYIFEYLDYMQFSYSRQESMNTLYCVHSLKEDVMLFKPLIWMLNYYEAVKKSGVYKKNNEEYAIRIDAKIKEDEKRDRKDKTSSGHYVYYVGLIDKTVIEHKELLIITEKEMNDFFKDHNSYQDAWKLKFKLAINLLAEES